MHYLVFALPLNSIMAFLQIIRACSGSLWAICNALALFGLVALLFPGLVSAQTNLIKNGGFEDVVQSRFGNNIGVSVAPWLIGGGSRPNIVKVDGPGGFDYYQYGPESDHNNPAGIGHYLDIVNGSNAAFQSFTVPECPARPTRAYALSGWFSTRDNRVGDASIEIREGSGLSGAVVPGSSVTVAVPVIVSSKIDPWTQAAATVNLSAGVTYSFVVNITDFANGDDFSVSLVDESYVCPVIRAAEDSGSALSATPIWAPVGGVTTTSVVANDSTNGNPNIEGAVNPVVVGTNATLAPGPAPIPNAGSITMSAATGLINVAPGTTPGVYSYPYTICTLPATVPPTCSSTTAAVVVSEVVIPFTESGTTQAGTTNAAVIANVRSNDTVYGQPATAANSTIAQSGVWPIGIVLEPVSGAVSVAATVAPGVYPVAYQLCDTVIVGNCATVQILITVASLPSSPTSIPTLSEWGLIILSLFMGILVIGYSRVRR